MLGAIKHITGDNFFSFRKTAHWYICIVHPTQSKLLWCSRLPLSWTVPPNSPELNALVTRFMESYSSISVSCQSKRLKKSSSDWSNA